MIFLRQKYKQKPKQYGSIATVQRNIFLNAERAGIDPTSIALCMPFWNGAGNTLYDVMGHHGYIPSYLGRTWTNGGVIFNNHADGYGVIPFSVDLRLDELSIFCVLDFAQSRQKTSVLSHINGEYWASELDVNSSYWPSDIYIQTGFNGVSDLGYNKFSSQETNILVGVSLSPPLGIHALYANGKQILYETDITGAFRDNQTTNLELHEPNNDAREFKFLLLTSKILTKSQHVYLSDNPYFLLQRNPDRTYFDFGVDGGSPINLADTATISEAISISVGASISDIGSGADVFGGMDANIPVADSGVGADIISPIASLAVTDTATAVDVVSHVLNSLLIQDTSSAIDSVSQIIAALAVADSGICADGVSLLSDILKTVSDVGAGVDAVGSPVVSLSLSDTGAGEDLIAAISTALYVQDVVAAEDLVNAIKTQLVQVSDLGQGADAVSMSVSLTVPDVATAAESVGQILASLGVTDSGIGTETAIATNFDLLPHGKVKITFSMKIPGASFEMKTPGATFTIN